MTSFIDLKNFSGCRKCEKNAGVSPKNFLNADNNSILEQPNKDGMKNAFFFHWDIGLLYRIKRAFFK